MHLNLITPEFFEYHSEATTPGRFRVRAVTPLTRRIVHDAQERDPLKGVDPGR